MQKLIITQWQLLLFGFLMTFFSAAGQTFFIALFGNEIRAELVLSHGQFGAIYSVATLLSAIVMIATGPLVDKWDLKWLSLILVIGLAIGCGLLSIASGLISLFIAVFLLRQLGQGLMCLTSSTTMVRYLYQDKGKATALAGLGYPVSEAILPVIVVSAIMLLGWRLTWQITALLLLIIALPTIVFLLQQYKKKQFLNVSRASTADSTDVSSSMTHWTRRQVLKDKRFYLFLPGLLSQQLMFTGFIFHQAHLVAYKQWSMSLWASIFIVYAIVAVTTKLIAGVVVDKIGALSMVPFLSLPMGIGLALLSLFDHVFVAFGFLLLMGITVGLQSTVSAPFWVELYGTRHIGAIKSLSASIMVFFTALSPVAIGVLLDIGITIDSIAFYSFVYVIVTSMVAYYAYWLHKTKHYIDYAR